MRLFSTLVSDHFVTTSYKYNYAQITLKASVLTVKEKRKFTKRLHDNTVVTSAQIWHYHSVMKKKIQAQQSLVIMWHTSGVQWIDGDDTLALKLCLTPGFARKTAIIFTVYLFIYFYRFTCTTYWYWNVCPWLNLFLSLFQHLSLSLFLYLSHSLIYMYIYIYIKEKYISKQIIKSLHFYKNWTFLMTFPWIMKKLVNAYKYF